MPVVFSPDQRFAVVGKTRSGKTTFDTWLVSLFAAQMAGTRWRVIWLDTKGDPKDHRRLEAAGFVRTDPRKLNRAKAPLLYCALKPSFDLSIKEQVQRIVAWAISRRNVLVVIDEYGHVVVSTVNCGPALDDAFTRGGGLGVGILGNTQEPVQIPRKLLSQPSHLFLFRVTYPRDVDYLRSLCPLYAIPGSDLHGFWHAWIDGDGVWRYFRNLDEFSARMGLQAGA